MISFINDEMVLIGTDTGSYSKVHLLNKESTLIDKMADAIVDVQCYNDEIMILTSQDGIYRAI